MKDKILMLVIGVLLGAIITAGCFILFGNNKKLEPQRDGEFKGGRMGNMVIQEPPQMNAGNSEEI